MERIYHKLIIEAPPEKVYEALTTREGLSGWWTPETKARPEAGSILRFDFGPDYFKEIEVIELRPSKTVKWLCIKAVEEWIGTTISFELQPHNKGTALLFRHEGWKEQTQLFATCSYDWALFLRSLRFFCVTGKGVAYPDQNK